MPNTSIIRLVKGPLEMTGNKGLKDTKEKPVEKNIICGGFTVSRANDGSGSRSSSSPGANCFT